MINELTTELSSAAAIFGRSCVQVAIARSMRHERTTHFMRNDYYYYY